MDNGSKFSFAYGLERIVLVLVLLSVIFMIVGSVGWYVFGMIDGILISLGRLGSFMVLPIIAFGLGSVYSQWIDLK